METLAKLGKIVEAKGMVIVDLLLVSGYVLKAKRGVEFPTSSHTEPPATIYSDDTKARHHIRCK